MAGENISVNLNIDWELLREQKLDLLNVIDLLQSESDDAAKKQADSLTGILYLIDDIQDDAVDNKGVAEDKVFNIEKT